jgi:NhaP-type Na+/H+ or K+/H+ antiporter
VAYLPRWLSGGLHEQAPKLRNRELAIISWCDMRGIVSLPAALALPAVLPNGEPFPTRDFIIFITFFVIAATVVGYLKRAGISWQYEVCGRDPMQSKEESSPSIPTLV